MKALILAAGLGKRMLPLTATTHKSCLPMRGKPLLVGQIQTLNKTGIDNITVVTGYRREEVIRTGGSSVDYLHNPFYESSNSIISVWLAKSLLTDDVLILNCDVVFNSTLIDNLCCSNGDCAVAVSRKFDESRGYKVEVNNEGYITNMGMKLNIPYAEYAGITLIRRHFTSAFIQQMNLCVENDQISIWYEDVIAQMASNNFSIVPIEVASGEWYEIDTVAELEYAQNNIKAW